MKPTVERKLQLQSEIFVSKMLSSLLADQTNNVARNCWENAQYSRRECLDVVGIPLHLT